MLCYILSISCYKYDISAQGLNEGLDWGMVLRLAKMECRRPTSARRTESVSVTVTGGLWLSHGCS